MPNSVLLPLNNNSRTSKIHKKQMEYFEKNKELLWTRIVKAKIINQKKNLENIGKSSDILEKYLNNINLYDKDNKEGLAARCYFKNYFDSSFKRFNDDIINSCLNYIYQVLRSRISQMIISKGLNPCIGIFHKSEYNNFCLSDDLMEPFRPLADAYVKNILENNENTVLTPRIKLLLVDFLNMKIFFNNANYSIASCLSSYIDNALDISKELLIPKICLPINIDK